MDHLDAAHQTGNVLQYRGLQGEVTVAFNELKQLSDTHANLCMYTCVNINTCTNICKS